MLTHNAAHREYFYFCCCNYCSNTIFLWFTLLHSFIDSRFRFFNENSSCCRCLKLAVFPLKLFIIFSSVFLWTFPLLFFKKYAKLDLLTDSSPCCQLCEFIFQKMANRPTFHSSLDKLSSFCWRLSVCLQIMSVSLQILASQQSCSSFTVTRKEMHLTKMNKHYILYIWQSSYMFYFFFSFYHKPW